MGLDAALRALSDVSKSPQDRKQLVQDLLDTGLPAFEKQLGQMQKNIAAAGPQPPSANPPPRPLFAATAIISGEQKYTDIRVPLLVHFCVAALYLAGCPQRPKQVGRI